MTEQSEQLGPGVSIVEKVLRHIIESSDLAWLPVGLQEAGWRSPDFPLPTMQTLISQEKNGLFYLGTMGLLSGLTL